MKIKRKNISKSPTKAKKPTKRETNAPTLLKNAKSQLLDYINEKNIGRKPTQPVDMLTDKDKVKGKQRKQKIGSLVSNMNNQAISNINLHMNFYQVDDKTLAGKSNNVIAQTNNTKKGFVSINKNKSEKKLVKNASMKKHASKKSITRYSVNKNTNLKIFKQSEIGNSKLGKPTKSCKREVKSKTLEAEGDNKKWDKIQQLMKKLKTKIEREDPEKIKIFKNIEKILKHVKGKKKGNKDKAIDAKRESNPNNVPMDTNNDKARLTTLHIDAPRKSSKMVVEENISEKYKFLEYLEPKSHSRVKDDKQFHDNVEKEQFLIRTLELVTTHNYFFLPKKDLKETKNVSIDNLDRVSPIRLNISKNDQSNIPKNFTRQNHTLGSDSSNKKSASRGIYVINDKRPQNMSSIDSSRPRKPLKIIAKPDMEIWATPSKHSIELITNEIALRMSKSHVEENLNRSIRNSSIMLHVNRKKDLGRSNRLESIGNFSKDVRVDEIKGTQSCQEFDQNLADADKDNIMLCDSIVRPITENGTNTIGPDKYNKEQMDKSWNDIEIFDKILKPSEKSLSKMFQNKTSSIEDNSVELEKDDKKVNDIDVLGLDNIAELVETAVIQELADDITADELYNIYLGILTPGNNVSKRNQSIKLKIDISKLSNDVELLDSIVSKLNIPKISGIKSIKQSTHDKKSDNQMLDEIRITDENLDDLREEKSIMDKSNETVYAVRTHFNAINEYIYILCDYLQSSEKWTSKSLLNMDRINDCQLIDLEDNLDGLNCYNRTFYESFSPLVLDSVKSEELFDDLENEIQHHCGQLSNMKELVKIQRIFHKSIFDCFIYNFTKMVINELIAVNKTRQSPFIQIRTNIISDKKIDKWVNAAIEKVIEICGFLCGIIRDKEDSMMADIKFIDDATLASLHDDRMMRMMVYDTLMYSRAWNDASLAARKLINLVSAEIESELFMDIIKEFNH